MKYCILIPLSIYTIFVFVRFVKGQILNKNERDYKDEDLNKLFDNLKDIDV